MFIELLVRPIEKLLNYVFYRPEHHSIVSQLIFKTHSIQLPNIMTLIIKWQQNELKISFGPQEQSDLNIIMPLPALAAYVLHNDLALAQKNGLQFSGDEQQAVLIQQLISMNKTHLNLILADFIGPSLSQKFLQLLHDLELKKTESVNSLMSMSSDYLQHELQIMPSTYEINEFLQAVDLLRNDCERLLQKFQSYQSLHQTQG